MLFLIVAGSIFFSVQEKIKLVSLDSLPQEVWPAAKCVDHIASDLVAMDDQCPVKFVYCSLIHFLPVWLLNKPSDGRMLLETALWSPSFMRWALAADACGMVKMSLSLAFHDICLRITNDQKQHGRAKYIAAAYDEVVRKSLAEKSSQGMTDISVSVTGHD